MLTIRDGIVITGDGETVLDQGTIYVEGDRILEIRSGKSPPAGEGDTVIDARDHVVFPGLINAHTHGCTVGPYFPTATTPLSMDEALKNLDKHLVYGTTSVINLDGFVLPDEVAAVNQIHPMNVFTGTTHTPSCIKAAMSIDGKGLTDRHQNTTAEEMVDAGAVLLGEVGGGVTLGGGGQDFWYIPSAVKEKTGVTLEPPQARDLRLSVLGPLMRQDYYDRQRVQGVLENMGLAGSLSPQEARDIICDTVLPPFNLSLDGFPESVAVGNKAGVPVLVHNSQTSEEATLEAARQLGPMLIAGHTSTVSNARDLRRLGATVEVCTLDTFGLGLKRPRSRGTEEVFSMLEEDLIDTWATDFAMGIFDPQLVGIEAVVRAGRAALPKLIALASRNVARIVSRVGDRGELAPGKVADIVVSPASHMSEVANVIVGGRVVYQDGKVLQNGATFV